MAKYALRVLLTGFDASRAKELKLALNRTMGRPGNARVSEVLGQVADGEKVVVYQSNSRQDAHDAAGTLARAGAEVEVVG